ncbi:MAG: 4-hydroxy-3-methylbut-2-enyl diphosphate reductase, partial [Candidatus Aminicenantes bacterium]|nr:4-hydroxy-3-methylbut-2-enyl diphosphate reductase [Candidatus Aminicenantes bacterium]
IARRTRRARRGPVATLGDLVHNPRISDDLRAEGIASAARPEAIASGTVIIRSHGVAPDVERALRARKLRVVDATCPIVKRIQRLVARLARNRTEIVIVGNPTHPEIRGLIGYSRGRARIVESAAQARALPFRRRREVLAQSTQEEGLFGETVAALCERTAELRVHNTICRATQTRQRSTSELAARVDALVIVGGRTSSNTKRLYEISRRILPSTYFVEHAREIDAARLRRARRVGVAGGASTPPEAIREAVAVLRAHSTESDRREIKRPCPM